MLAVVAVVVVASVVSPSGPSKPHTLRAAALRCQVPPSSVVVDGVRRTYRLCLPPSRQGPVPLVVALHGLGGSGSSMLRQTGLGQATSAAGVGLLVPDSVAGAWNDGRLGPEGPRDEQFVLTLVRSVTGTGLADPRRVSLTGFSNGADMALVLASRHPEAFAAVVGVSAHLLARAGAARPTRPIPTYLVYGSTDAVQPTDGRPDRGRLRPALLSASATSKAFVRVGAASFAERVDSRRAGVHVIREHHASAPRGAPVDVIELEGAGHVWPRTGVDASALVVEVALRYSR